MAKKGEMTDEEIAAIVASLDEQEVARIVRELAYRGRVISESTVLFWIGIGTDAEAPHSARMHVKDILLILFERGLLQQRPRMHSARTGHVEVGYDLAPIGRN
jgi:hypothetical protein